jgi:site-specific recombinase XerD
MFGKVDGQIARLCQISGIKAETGTKRDTAKQAVHRSFQEQYGRNATSAEMSRNIQIFSQKSLENNESTWRQLGEFMRGNGVKDLEKTSNRQVEKFLISKIEQDVSHKYYQNICSHIVKLEKALTDYSAKEGTEKSYDFSKAINFCKEKADVLEKEIEARAYSNAGALVEQIKDERFQIAAAVMHEGGARINEASLITESRLGGTRVDDVRGEVGVIKLESGDTKGGKEREIMISKETYDRISSIVHEQGKFQIPKSERQELRESIREAAGETGQKYTGAHGLRHSYAQERVSELQNMGKSYLEAIGQVSKEMGHERPSITEHYLKT